MTIVEVGVSVRTHNTHLAHCHRGRLQLWTKNKKKKREASLKQEAARQRNIGEEYDDTVLSRYDQYDRPTIFGYIIIIIILLRRVQTAKPYAVSYV